MRLRLAGLILVALITIPNIGEWLPFIPDVVWDGNTYEVAGR